MGKRPGSPQPFGYQHFPGPVPGSSRAHPGFAAKAAELPRGTGRTRCCTTSANGSFYF